MRKNGPTKSFLADSMSQNSTESTLVTSCSRRSAVSSPSSGPTETIDNCDHTLVSRIITNATARLAAVPKDDPLKLQCCSSFQHSEGTAMVRAKSERTPHIIALQCDDKNNDQHDDQCLSTSGLNQQHRICSGDRSRAFKKATSSYIERNILRKAPSSTSSLVYSGRRPRQSRRVGSSLRRLSLKRMSENCEDDQETPKLWTDGADPESTRTKSSKRGCDDGTGNEKASIDGTSFSLLLKQLQGAKVEGMKYSSDGGLESPWGLKGDELKESREHSVVGKMVKAVWRGWKDSSSERSSECGSGDSDLELDLDTEGTRESTGTDRIEEEQRQGRASSTCREVEMTKDDFIDFCSPSPNSRARSMFHWRARIASPR